MVEILSALIIGFALGNANMYYLAYREMKKIREQNEIILKRTAPGK